MTSTEQEKTEGYNVDTNNWDTVFAVRYNFANKAIQDGWDKVNAGAKTITNYVVDGTTLNANLGPWQLCEGGDGRNLWMTIPFVKGTVHIPIPGYKEVQLDGAVMKVEINLNYVPDPTKAGSKQLKTASGNDDDATNVRHITFPPEAKVKSIAQAIVQGVLEDWLTKNIGEFNHVFHQISIVDAIDQDSKYKFLKPSAVSYGVTDKGSMDTSVFGILTMSQDNADKTPPKVHLVSPNAIPKGCDAGFNISGPQYVKNMLLTGAAMQFAFPPEVKQYNVKTEPEKFEAAFNAWVAKAFKFTDNGMTVTNTEQMKFNDFKDEDENVMELFIPKESFTLSLDYTWLKMEFIDLNYESSPGINVHMNYTQKFHVVLAEATDPKTGKPKKVFAVDKDSTIRVCNVSVHKSEALKWSEIGLSIGLATAGAILGGLAGGAAGNLVRGAGEALAQGMAEGSEGLLEGVLIAEGDAGSKAGLELSTQSIIDTVLEVGGEQLGRLSGFLGRIWPKLLGGMIGAAVGDSIALIPSYVELAASSKYDDLPGFDLFVDECVNSHQWPNGTEFDLKSVSLATAFQIGLDHKK